MIETQLNIGRLLMSEKAYKDLLSLDLVLSKAEGEDDLVKQLSGIRVKTEDCIFSFIPHAKEDLRVQNI